MNASLLRRLVLSLALASGVAMAHDGDEETVRPLMKQMPSDIPGKDVMMATVTLAPGQSAAPHLHPGSIFAFVLEDDRNAHARARFDLVVGVIELPSQTSCHCAPNRGLARPHQSDKYYVFQHKSLIFGFQPPIIPGYASGVRNASPRRARQ